MTPTERLQRLYRILDAVPDENFNMSRFTSRCGTVHCLAGWAAVDPILVADGMPNVNSDLYWDTVELDLDGRSWKDLSEFFGLNNDDTVALFGGNLFDGQFEVSKDDVRDNISRVVNRLPALRYQDADEEY